MTLPDRLPPALWNAAALAQPKAVRADLVGVVEEVRDDVVAPALCSCARGSIVVIRAPEECIHQYGAIAGQTSSLPAKADEDVIACGARLVRSLLGEVVRSDPAND